MALSPNAVCVRPRVVFAWIFATVLTVASNPVRADTVATWMTVSEQAQLKAEKNDPHWRTAANTRADAQVALAIFEAVNAIEGRYRSYLGVPAAPKGTSAEAAAASAAHTVLVALFPDQKKLFDDALTVSLARVAKGTEKMAGVELGKRTAAAAMARAALPAGTALAYYRPVTKPGEYIDPGLPSILPFDLLMPPFFLARADELRPPAPPALTSERYARDLEEVKRLGAKNSKDRPADQTLLAQPWLSIDSMSMLGDVARQPGRSLSQNARMYALFAMASEDTWLAIMEAKMHYRRWRPITAIRNADQDGNDATTRDEAWEPLLPTPQHPDYPCGHCGYAAGFATVMEAETQPAPAGGITVRSHDEYPGMTITVPTWKAFVDEMSMSRIYAGAHTRTAVEAAEAIGRKVARRALTGFMQPNSRPPSPPAT
jgi:hypothetical protein